MPFSTDKKFSARKRKKPARKVTTGMHGPLRTGLGSAHPGRRRATARGSWRSADGLGIARADAPFLERIAPRGTTGPKTLWPQPSSGLHPLNRTEDFPLSPSKKRPGKHTGKGRNLAPFPGSRFARAAACRTKSDFFPVPRKDGTKKHGPR